MGKRRLIERTDGRRKGYKPHTSLVEDRLPADVRRKLEAIRGPKPDRKMDRGRPERKEA